MKSLIKKSFYSIFLLTCLFTIGEQKAFSQEINNIETKETYKNKILAIADIKGQEEWVRQYLYNNYRDRIVNLKRFRVVERNNKDLLKIINEFDLSNTNLINKSTAPKLEEFLGAGYIIFIEYSGLNTIYESGSGSSKGYYKCSVSSSVRYVNTETGEILDAVSSNAEGVASENQDAINEALSKLIDEMVLSTREIFAIKGLITKRDGYNVRINLGSNDGVKENMTFSVFQEDDGIKKEVGYFNITSVGKDFSEGTIKDGFWKIKDGNSVKELARGRNPINISISYENIGVKGELSSLLNETQKQKFLEPNRANLVSINGSMTPVWSDPFGVSLGLGFLTSSNYSGLALDGNIIGKLDIIPELLGLNFNIGPSIYMLSQSKENFLGTNQNDLSMLSSASGGFSSFALGLTAGITGNMHLGKSINLFVNSSYRISSSAADWEAIIDKNNKIVLKNNSDSIAYRQLQILGLSFGGGIGYSF